MDLPEVYMLFLMFAAFLISLALMADLLMFLFYARRRHAMGPKFKVGDPVEVRLAKGWVRASVFEDKGETGEDGRRMYSVKIPLGGGELFQELPENAIRPEKPEGYPSSESYPDGWVTLELSVGPDGEYHALGGDREAGEGDAPFIGMERLKKAQEQRPSERERYYHAVLTRIASYEDPERLKEASEDEYGVEPSEAVEMAYENVLGEAEVALKKFPNPMTKN